MRPATRVLPKALIPVVDRPAVQYVVEEAARAGATEVVLVVDPGVGELVERHFYEEGPLPGLEDTKVMAIVQEEALGLGDAILTSEAVVGDQPFFCLLADNIAPAGGDILPSLTDAADGGSVVAVRELAPEWLGRYGVVIPGDRLSGEVMDVSGAVEKPGPDSAPSNLGLVGRYLFMPEVFGLLGSQETGHGGEVQITDTIDHIARAGRCRAVIMAHDLLDTGNPLSYVEAATRLALESEEYGSDFKEFLDRLGS